MCNGIYFNLIGFLNDYYSVKCFHYLFIDGYRLLIMINFRTNQ
jgi:hypothetical protein